MCRPESTAEGHTLNYSSRDVVDVPGLVSTASSFALSVQNEVSVRGRQWPGKPTRTNGVTRERNRFLWVFKSLPPCHRLYEVQWLLNGWLQSVFTNSLSLHSGCWLHSRHWHSVPLPLWRIWVPKLSDSFCCAAWEFREKKKKNSAKHHSLVEWKNEWIIELRQNLRRNQVV